MPELPGRAAALLRLAVDSATGPVLASSMRPTGRSPVKVVASSSVGLTALRYIQADYQCDGVADDVQIQEAIDALDATYGGVVLLTEGIYNTVAKISMRSNSALVGMGRGTEDAIATTSGGTVLSGAAGITVIEALDKNAFVISDMKIYGGLSGIEVLTTLAAGVIRDMTLARLHIVGQVGAAGYGLRLEGASFADRIAVPMLDDILVRNTQGYGIYCRQVYDFSGWRKIYAIGTNSAQTAAGSAVTFHTCVNGEIFSLHGEWAGSGNPTTGLEFRGVNFTGCTEIDVYGIKCDNNNAQGLLINTACEKINIHGGRLVDNGKDTTVINNSRVGGNLSADSTNIGLYAVHIYRAVTQLSGLHIVGATDIVQGCHFGTHSTAKINTITAGAIIRDNPGFKTENKVTFTIANGATTAVVAHGLDVTPTLGDLMVTWGENPTNTPGAWWIDTIGATNVTVNVENDPGASAFDGVLIARCLF